MLTNALSLKVDISVLICKRENGGEIKYIYSLKLSVQNNPFSKYARVTSKKLNSKSLNDASV